MRTPPNESATPRPAVAMKYRRELRERSSYHVGRRVAMEKHKRKRRPSIEQQALIARKGRLGQYFVKHASTATTTHSRTSTESLMI